MMENYEQKKYHQLDPKYANQMYKEKYKNIAEITNLVKDNQRFNDNIEILNYINSGACGIVYEGKFKKSNKHVALKFILNKRLDSKRDKKQSSQKDKNYRQITKEITLQSKLKNKNITMLYACFELPYESSCIAMELAAYGDLELIQKKLKKKTLSETMLGYLAKQILNALDCCHKNKIIHMDIKHQNILLDNDLNVKLADLSVSFSYFDSPPNSFITLPLAGTSLFMSPEVLGKQEVKVENCNKIDMFSLGTLLYNLAFYEYPYGLEYSDKKNFDIIKEKICKKPLIFPTKNSYSQMFLNFLTGLLNKKIKDRTSINEAMRDPWIKGVNYIMLEKEKIYDVEKFLINCITNNVKAFNDYIQS